MWGRAGTPARSRAWSSCPTPPTRISVYAEEWGLVGVRAARPLAFIIDTAWLPPTRDTYSPARRHQVAALLVYVIVNGSDRGIFRGGVPLPLVATAPRRCRCWPAGVLMSIIIPEAGRHECGAGCWGSTRGFSRGCVELEIPVCCTVSFSPVPHRLRPPLPPSCRARACRFARELAASDGLVRNRRAGHPGEGERCGRSSDDRAPRPNQAVGLPAISSPPAHRRRGGVLSRQPRADRGRRG